MCVATRIEMGFRKLIFGQVTIEMVNVLYDFGNFQYSCGNYPAAAELLYQFRILSTDNDKVSTLR